MTDVRHLSSRRQRLDQAFLSQKLQDAKSYRRIAGYFRSSTQDHEQLLSNQPLPG